MLRDSQALINGFRASLGGLEVEGVVGHECLYARVGSMESVGAQVLVGVFDRSHQLRWA